MGRHARRKSKAPVSGNQRLGHFSIINLKPQNEDYYFRILMIPTVLLVRNLKMKRDPALAKELLVSIL